MRFPTARPGAAALATNAAPINASIHGALRFEKSGPYAVARIASAGTMGSR